MDRLKARLRFGAASSRGRRAPPLPPSLSPLEDEESSRERARDPRARARGGLPLGRRREDPRSSVRGELRCAGAEGSCRRARLGPHGCARRGVVCSARGEDSLRCGRPPREDPRSSVRGEARGGPFGSGESLRAGRELEVLSLYGEVGPFGPRTFARGGRPRRAVEAGSALASGGGAVRSRAGDGPSAVVGDASRSSAGDRRGQRRGDGPVADLRVGVDGAKRRGPVLTCAERDVSCGPRPSGTGARRGAGATRLESGPSPASTRCRPSRAGAIRDSVTRKRSDRSTP